ncbi:MAG: sulfite exporter TauE/SafE family protein [Candidatus Tectimicrobiota bacterium]
MTGLNTAWRTALGVLLLFGSALLHRQAVAHPLGNLSINHYSALHITREAIELHYILELAEIPTFQVLQETGLVPVPEHPSATLYLAQQSQMYATRLQLTLNAQPLALHPVSTAILFPPGAGGLPTLKLDIMYRAPYQALTSQTDYLLDYQDRNFPGRTGWQEIIATADTGVTVLQRSVPALDRSRALTAYPTDPLSSPPQMLTATVQFQHVAVPLSSPHPLLPAPPTAQPTMARTTQPQGVPQHAFTALITVPHLNVSTVALALALAAALGAFHALEPGHGKAVVAAYLVGTRGTARHAFSLGMIVTLTHTAGVYLLGGVTLYASRYIVPERLYPWLGILSGLLMTGLGVALLYQRWTARVAPHQHTHATPLEARPQGPELALAHSHAHPQPQAHCHAISSQAHRHEPTTAPLTRHQHQHQHQHQHHAHAHQHVVQAHQHDALLSWRALVTLGITGGLIPCPAALVVLLSAVVMQRIGFGLLLIVAFSMGLATVLIALGLLMVYARHFMRRFQGEGPLLQRWLPLTSAVLVTLFGLLVLGQTMIKSGIVQIRL